MSQFRNAIQRSDQHIKSLRIACAFLILLALITSSGWMLAPRSMTIHNPPDLRTGSTRPWWEVPPSSVYAFAFYIFQQLNAWPKNGEIDYPAKIRALSPYLTPGCKDFLERDATERTNRNELIDRVRVVYEIPERGYSTKSVTVRDRDNWVALLDLVADEYFHTEPVKRAMVRYPMKVTRWNGDPETNQFGLALDCYDGVPQRLEAAPPEPKPEHRGCFDEYAHQIACCQQADIGGVASGNTCTESGSGG